MTCTFFMQSLQGVEGKKNISGGVADTCGWLLCMCVSEANAITSSAACLICWPFILSGLLLQPFMSYCPNNGHLEHCHTRCSFTKYSFLLACSLQHCLNDSRLVSMDTNPCPYKALWRFSTTHPLSTSSVFSSLSHTFTPPPHKLCRIHQM